MRKKLFAIIGIILITFAPGCNKKNSQVMEKAKETGINFFSRFKKTAGKNDLLYLKNKINTYKRQNGRYPESLQQLVNEGFIEKIPEPPPGTQYVYDPATGRVSLK